MIHPLTGHIPQCSVCKEDVSQKPTKLKNNTLSIEFDHNNACLWYDYFAERIMRKYPGISIVRKTDRRLKSQK